MTIPQLEALIRLLGPDFKVANLPDAWRKG